VALAHPQNETFFGKSAANSQRFHPTAGHGAQGQKLPSGALTLAETAARVAFYAGSIPQNTPQTRRPLRELIFTQELPRHASIAR
jgi:hypothetical protein